MVSSNLVLTSGPRGQSAPSGFGIRTALQVAVLDSRSAIMLKLNQSDWRAIFHAIEFQLINGSGPEQRKWQKQLSAVRQKIGLDGQIAAREGVSSALAQMKGERLRKFRVRVKDCHGWSLYETGIETKERARRIAARARKERGNTKVRIEEYRHSSTDTKLGR